MASKILYIEKTLYNSFKIDFQYNNEAEKRMTSYESDCLFSMGLLDTR